MHDKTKDEITKDEVNDLLSTYFDLDSIKLIENKKKRWLKIK